MTKPIRILNVGGHPKDVIAYAGGAMAKHAARGDKVCMLTPTTGLALHHKAIDDYKTTGKNPDLDTLINERKQELIDASAELGVKDVRFLGYPDDIPVIDKRIVSDIADVIGEIRPDVIITHWPQDSSPAHAVTAQMTLLALETASTIRPGKPYAPSGGGEGVHAPQILYHTSAGRSNVLENLTIRIPTMVIDISDVIKQKSRAMNKFKSQDYGEDIPLQRKGGEASDGSLHAIHSRVAYAETFVTHNPQVYDYIHISEYGQKLASRPKYEALKSWTTMAWD